MDAKYTNYIQESHHNSHEIFKDQNQHNTVLVVRWHIVSVADQQRESSFINHRLLTVEYSQQEQHKITTLWCGRWSNNNTILPMFVQDYYHYTSTVVGTDVKDVLRFLYCKIEKRVFNVFY